MDLIDTIAPYIVPAILAIFQGIILYRDWKKEKALTKKAEEDARKSKAEARRAENEADTGPAKILVDSALELAAAQSPVIATLVKQIKDLQVEIAKIPGLEKEIRQAKQREEESKQLILDLRDWAERLVNQVHTLDPKAEPEPFRSHFFYTPKQ